jgi:Flp pilus assembly protein TadG
MKRLRPYKGLSPLRETRVKVSRSSSGSQLLEFALVTPLLIAMVVGILDFGEAYNLKQKLNNAAREGARFSIEEPSADISQAAPPTTQAIENSIVNYLTNAGVNLCGLTGTTTPTVGPQPYASWTFTSPQQCPGTPPPPPPPAPPPAYSFTIEIDRGNTFVNSSGAKVPSSLIIVNSPYVWTFNRIIALLVPGANYQAVTTISSSALMEN